MKAATVVQVLHGLFYVLLQLLVVAAVILRFNFYCKFYCKFHCSCDPSFIVLTTSKHFKSFFSDSSCFRFLARHSMLSALYAIANPSVCPSVRPSVTRVDQSKTVEARIMQFSPYSSPIPLVFAR